MAVRNLEAVQRLSGSARQAESRPGRIGPISLGAKQTGERRCGKSARCVRRGGDWKRGMVEIPGHTGAPALDPTDERCALQAR